MADRIPYTSDTKIKMLAAYPLSNSRQRIIDILLADGCDQSSAEARADAEIAAAAERIAVIEREESVLAATEDMEG